VGGGSSRGKDFSKWKENWSFSQKREGAGVREGDDQGNNGEGDQEIKSSENVVRTDARRPAGGTRWGMGYGLES